MSNDDLAKFKGSPQMGGCPGFATGGVVPTSPADEFQPLLTNERLVPTKVYRQHQFRSLELLLIQGCSSNINAMREQAVQVERRLRAGINKLVETANEMDLKEGHKEAISFHLFRKLDELASAIDTVNEKIDAIQSVDLEAVIKRLCNED